MLPSILLCGESLWTHVHVRSHDDVSRTGVQSVQGGQQEPHSEKYEASGESVAMSRQQYLNARCLLCAASQVVGPIAHEKAENLLPVSKAAFAEVRATNAALRASDASLEASNAQNVAVLDAAEAKLQELFPVGPDSCTCPCTHSCACAN